MKDLTVDLREPVFVFRLDGYLDAVRPPRPEVPRAQSVVGVTEITNRDEILLLRAAAKEAMNDSR